MSNETKVIFLDIDGVLVTRDSFNIPRLGNRTAFDQRCVAELNRITDTTGACIVVSSTWRILYETLDDMAYMLEQQGVTGKVIGSTPKLCNFNGVIHFSPPRGTEIKTWLAQNGHVERFVILDDDSDMGSLLSHLLKSSMETGLTEQIANEAIRRLSE